MISSKEYIKLLEKIEPMPRITEGITDWHPPNSGRIKTRMEMIVQKIAEIFSIPEPKIKIESRATLVYIDKRIVKESTGLFTINRRTKICTITISMATYEDKSYNGKKIFSTFIHEVQHWIDVLLFGIAIHDRSFYRRAKLLAKKLVQE